MKLVEAIEIPTAKIQFKRGTSLEWEQHNVVLASGQPGYDKTNNLLKIGNGRDSWKSLSYLGTNSQSDDLYADFILAEETHNGYLIRKWNSGLVECFGVGSLLDEVTQMFGTVLYKSSTGNHFEISGYMETAIITPQDTPPAILPTKLSASSATTVSTADPSESGYLWPLPGYTALSSLFDGRLDPFTGEPANHTGIDVPAPLGVKILAAMDGNVRVSTNDEKGYGNYVSIGHDNGEITLYAHMSERNVNVGDIVVQGQVIGYVGSTGRSTGNHLHYEVREKATNKKTDPLLKYKGMKFTYKEEIITP